MSRHLLASLGLALFALPALGQVESAFRLYLSTDGVTGNQPLAGLSPAQENPVVDTSAGPVDLYVWAQVLGTATPQLYFSVGYNAVTNGSLQIIEARTWNYTNLLQRWVVANPGTVAGGELLNVRLGGSPLGSNFCVADHDTMGYDLQFDPLTTSTVLGTLKVQGEGELFLQIGQMSITRGSSYDPVYLGFGDENFGLFGNNWDISSPIPEATVIPEPASLMLLGLALIARRR